MNLKSTSVAWTLLAFAGCTGSTEKADQDVPDTGTQAPGPSVGPVAPGPGGGAVPVGGSVGPSDVSGPPPSGAGIPSGGDTSQGQPTAPPTPGSEPQLGGSATSSVAPPATLGGTPTIGAGGTSPSGAGGQSAGGRGGVGVGGQGGADSGEQGGQNMGTGGVDGATDTGPVTVALDRTRQTIQGFGINDTYASQTLPASLFDVEDDIGLTILRVGMNSGGNFYNDRVQSADVDMVNGISDSKIIGSCWSAPANCKDNNSENDGGHLKTSCYESWATTMADFGTAHNLYAMSIVNEPDFASCGTMDPCNGNYPTMLYTANELVEFVKVAGPKLQEAGIKVIAPEASEWNHLWSNESAGPNPGGKNSSDPLKCGFPPDNPDCDTGGGYDYGHYLAQDAAAWAAFDIIGTHEYDSQQAYPWPEDVTVAKKEIWETEMSGVKWWPEQGPSSDIANGIAVAGWIHSALVVGEASAWLYWWYTTSNDNEGLFLGSTDTKRHYTMGNYSKFVRPGYSRVEIRGAVPTDVLLSAYSGPDGTVVVVAINKGADTSLPIGIAGGAVPSSLTPWVTSASDDLEAQSAVPVSNGSFTAELGASTVTTFVGK